MSRIKTYLEDHIAALSKKSGYPEDFLTERFSDCMEEASRDGVEFDLRQFDAISLERDW